MVELKLEDSHGNLNQDFFHWTYIPRKLLIINNHYKLT